MSRRTNFFIKTYQGKRFCVNLGAAKTLKYFVIQCVSEESRGHKVDVHEILPPFGRLNDI